MSFALSPVFALILGRSVRLGSMLFTDFEVPSKINYGGSQQVTVHKLPGGRRVMDDTGDDPVAIGWSGLFFGLGAQQRRDQLQAMRLQGGLIELAFDDQNYLVKLREATFELEGPNRISYRVSCEVMPVLPPDDQRDDLGTGAPPTTETDAKDQGQSALTTARAHASSIPVPPVPPAIIPAPPSVGDFGPQSTSFG